MQAPQGQTAHPVILPVARVEVQWSSWGVFQENPPGVTPRSDSSQRRVRFSLSPAPVSVYTSGCSFLVSSTLAQISCDMTGDAAQPSQPVTELVLMHTSRYRGLAQLAYTHSDSCECH